MTSLDNSTPSSSPKALSASPFPQQLGKGNNA